MFKPLSAVLLFLAIPVAALAQPSTVSFNASTKVFRLDGGDVSYVFGVNARGELQQLYWGARLAATDSFEQASRSPSGLPSTPPITTPRRSTPAGAQDCSPSLP